MTDGAEITCREMVELMTDYLEGAMSPQTRTRFDRHLATCEACTNYLDQLRETIRVTGMFAEDQIPAEQKAELLKAFRDWRRSD